MKTERQSQKDLEFEMEELRQENARLRMLLEHVGDGLVVLGPDCGVIWRNDAAEHGSGPNGGKNCQILDHCEPEQCKLCPVAKAFASGDTETGIIDFVTGSGEERRYLLLTANPVLDEDDSGCAAQVAVFTQDVTEHQRVQRELEKRTETLEIQNRRALETARQKSRFFASMSHELRTPLTSIIGFTEILEEDTDDPLSPNQRNLLLKISRNSERLLRMLNDFLEFSKIESGRMTVNLSRVDLPTLVEQIVETMMPLVKDKPLTICAEIAGDLPVMRTDEMKLSQILINLISNAIKFTPEGAVTVSAARSGNRIRISVADTGVGIRRADFSRIFEEFTQADCAVGRRIGTGLGLAITRKLVHILGGDIRVTSKLGNGSEFRITLPVSLSQSLMEKRLKRIVE